jgi:hypothetical protein
MAEWHPCALCGRKLIYDPYGDIPKGMIKALCSPCFRTHRPIIVKRQRGKIDVEVKPQ